MSGFSESMGANDINFLKIAFVLHLIQAFFEGGLRKFSEDGGQVIALPDVKETILMYHPVPIAESLQKKLWEQAEKMRVEFKFVTDLNWEDMTEEESVIELQNTVFPVIEAHKEKVILHVTRMVVSVEFMKKPSKKILQNVTEALLKTRGFIRGYIISPEHRMWVEKEASSEEPSVPAETSTQAQDDTAYLGDIKAGRTHVINYEDIIDLKIQLESDPWKLFE